MRHVRWLGVGLVVGAVGVFTGCGEKKEKTVIVEERHRHHDREVIVEEKGRHHKKDVVIVEEKKHHHK